MASVLTHVSFFIAAVAALWFFSGLLVEAVDKVALGLNRSGFVVAFFLLGFLTSLSELSVALNAMIDGVPQIAAGNLVGASFVILLLIVPLLAVAGNGISIKNTLSHRNFAFALGVVVLPALLFADGEVSVVEGVAALLAYLGLLLAICRGAPSLPLAVADHGGPAPPRVEKREAFMALARVAVSAAAIFFAGDVLVSESVYFAEKLAVPRSLVGLTLLSLGTNIPESVVAVRAITKGKKDIAFGNYLGSSVANTAIFGSLSLACGAFTLQGRDLAATSALLVAGLIVLYFFARSKSTISRREGMVLLLFYAGFLALQAHALLEEP